MPPSTSTDDGFPVRCEVCGTSSIVHVSRPPGDSVCPACGSFLWVAALVEVTRRHAFTPDVRITQLAATERDDAIRELSQAMADALDWTAEQQGTLVDSVLAREALGSTGIGRGLALPHAAVDWLDRCRTAMAFSPNEIPFDALDGEPVQTILLIASPKSRPGEHLRLLEQLARALRGLGFSTRDN